MNWIIAVYLLAVLLGSISGYHYSRSYKRNDGIIFVPGVIIIVISGIISLEYEWWHFIVVIITWIVSCILSYLITVRLSGSQRINEQRSEYLNEGVCPNCKRPLTSNTIRCSQCDDGLICPRCGTCSNIKKHRSTK